MDSGYGNYGNYSNTTYSAGGGANGGGGFLSGGSQTSPSGGSNFKNDSLRPVTIKQVMEAETADQTDFKIDGSPISQITIVGQVRNISTQTTNITYRIDDGTGVVEVKVWIDPDKAEDGSRPQIRENTYVRSWGKLKAFHNKRHIGAHFVRPIQDMNEVNYHLLEATLTHLHFTKGPPGSKEEGGMSGDASKLATNGANRGFQLPPEYSNEARKVYHIMRTEPSGNEGLHKQDIAQRAHMELVDVQRGGDELLNAGLIFVTVDEDTWQLMNQHE